MQPIPRLITLQAITFLHPGTGQTSGVVDLPIQREVHTGYPMFAASGLKGSLRDKAEQVWGSDDPTVETLFGSAVSNEGKPNAGCISFTDARILAFPVRSLQQVFVWVTCPMVLQRLQRDVKLLGVTFPDLNMEDMSDNTAYVSSESQFAGPLILEELFFEVSKTKKVSDLGDGLERLFDKDAGFDKSRLVILPNDDFQHLVRYATQVSARIKLNERKTTDGDGGNLWYEETLPPETLMYGLALCHKPRRENSKIGTADEVTEKLEELLSQQFLQIGGNETVGQGWCWVGVNRSLPHEE